MPKAFNIYVFLKEALQSFKSHMYAENYLEFEISGLDSLG